MTNKSKIVKVGRPEFTPGIIEIAKAGAAWTPHPGFRVSDMEGSISVDAWANLGLKAIRKGRKKKARITQLKNGVKLEVL